MKKTKFSALLLACALIAFPFASAMADGYRLATQKFPNEFVTLSAGSIAAGDFIAVWDASAHDWKRVDATAVPVGGTFTGAVVGTTGTFSSTLGLAGAVTIDDGTGASPSVTIQDGTDETAVFSKVDAGFLTLTTDATDGLNVLTGNLKIGNGTPGLTQNGEDGYVEGTFEVDGATQLDGALAVAGASTISGSVTGDGGDALYGYKVNQIASTTTAVTLAQCGSTFVSDSADVMTLPEASTVLGCRYTFVCGNAGDFDINPADGTDTIGSISTTNGTTGVVTLAPSAGDAIRCTDIGGSITLQATSADLWLQVAGGNGIWTDVN